MLDYLACVDVCTPLRHDKQDGRKIHKLFLTHSLIPPNENPDLSGGMGSAKFFFEKFCRTHATTSKRSMPFSANSCRIMLCE